MSSRRLFLLIALSHLAACGSESTSPQSTVSEAQKDMRLSPRDMSPSQEMSRPDLALPKVDMQVVLDQSVEKDIASTAQDAGREDMLDMQEGGQDMALNVSEYSELTITVRTEDVMFAGTNDPARLCLGKDRCFPLLIDTFETLQRGQTDVIHLPLKDFSKESFDRVVLETMSAPVEDNDQWTPECLEIRLDGEPVYCNDALDVKIGTGSGSKEVISWSDKNFKVSSCQTCWPSTLTHGPILGVPTSTSVRVGLRADASRPVVLRLSTQSDLSSAVAVVAGTPKPEDDYHLDLEAQGLEPDTLYYYRVEVDGAKDQPIRTVRTAPKEGESSAFKLSYGSCTRGDKQPIFTEIEQGKPDLFLFLGDNTYADSQELDAHRWHYRQARAVKERAFLVASVPTAATWDDHDFLDNNSHGECLGRADTLRAFKETWANSSYGLPNSPGVFSKVTRGDVDIFMLDCRMNRPDVGDSRSNCVLDPNPPALKREQGPLGPVQEAWLFDELKQSKAAFKFLACGSRFNPEGSNDSWKSFPDARNRLFNFIDTQSVEGVIFLTGDIHRSFVSRLPAPAYDIPELVSSPLASSFGACRGSDPDSCVTGRNMFMELEVDTARQDPEVDVTLLGEGREVLGTWKIKQSELKK